MLRRTIWACLVLLAAGGSRGEPPVAKVEKLFDGQTLGGWKATQFGGEGDVYIEDGKIFLGTGDPLTGITWSREVVRQNYEISLEAMRASGDDFFCALTFPVGDDPCSLIVGGWGGATVGLSSLDGLDASENDTTSYHAFESERWYKIRLRVAPDKIEAWIDDQRVVNVETKDRKISIRGEVDASRPLGIASYRTTAALRNIALRRL